MKKRNKKGKNALLLIFILLLGLFFLSLGRNIGMNKALKNNHNQEEFFVLLADLAQKTGEDYDLYPSVILAQAALESSYGKSQLSQKYHNYFGIKGTKERGVALETEEIIEGDRQKIKDYFRSYSSVKESFKDYGRLIGEKDRYKIVREAKSPQEYAQNLYKAGYSTNPKYGQVLIEIMDKYDLYQYDNNFTLSE